MSRRRSVTTRGRSRGRSRGHRTSRLGALLIFLVFCLLLGGIANTSPVPDGLIGAGVAVVALLCWILAAGSGRRH